MRKYAIVAVGLLLSLVLGATLFREPIAWAAQSVDANIIGPLDGNNVRVHEEGTAAVHEQGTVQVAGTVNVGNLPAGQILRSEMMPPGGIGIGESMQVPGGIVVTDVAYWVQPGVCTRPRLLIYKINPNGFYVDLDGEGTQQLHLQSGIRSVEGNHVTLYNRSSSGSCYFEVSWSGYEG